jgi:hypothetical protein
MAGFRLDEKRTQPRPDRRLGIKLEDPASKQGLKGKLDGYLPPELQYEYKPPSVFARYRVLTALFVALLLGLLGLWAAAVRRPPAPNALRPAAREQASPVAAPNKAPDQPIYIEPLPTK